MTVRYSNLSLLLGGNANTVVNSTFFALGSVAFAVAWACKRHDIQGASGVAAWIMSLAVIMVSTVTYHPSLRNEEELTVLCAG